ncbi:hypothetical protein CEXT_799711 [Caerostris extrusa]|uniref:Uncharacterized protein n=1 Tax=Caerostris extrusa TaxID=172846 RepID=A0AAV4MVV0_CAEEX|nr:hypothetical protein CEXT_799711 [Caerostris extrusa]
MGIFPIHTEINYSVSRSSSFKGSPIKSFYSSQSFVTFVTREGVPCAAPILLEARTVRQMVLQHYLQPESAGKREKGNGCGMVQFLFLSWGMVG